MKCYRPVIMNIRTTDELAAAIQTRRKRLGITQKELAMACGTGLRFIVDLEKGKRTCQIGKALQVLQALGLVIEVTSLSGVDRVNNKP